MKKSIYLLLLAMLLLTACLRDSEVRRVKKMEGTWNVATIQLDSVGEDGTHRTLFTGNDAGTFVFSPSFEGDSYFTEFNYDYYVRGQHVVFNGSATYDDALERLQVYFENCGEIFNCDGMYEVKTFSRSQMEMTRYLPTGIVGRVKYLTFTLKKQ